MPPRQGNAASPQKWMEYARADLALARIDLPPEATYDALCFHAQQAAEKSIKAVLVHLGIEFPYTHNIQIAASLLPPELQSVAAIEEAEALSPYAVLARYPSEREPVDDQRYRRLLGIAAAVVEWVEEYLFRQT